MKRKWQLVLLISCAAALSSCTDAGASGVPATDWSSEIPFATWAAPQVGPIARAEGRIDFVEGCAVLTRFAPTTELPPVTLRLPNRGELSWSEETQQLRVGDVIIASGSEVALAAPLVPVPASALELMETCGNEALQTRGISLSGSR